MFNQNDDASRSRLAVVTFSAVTAAFLTVRLAYLLVREPFFDELFTVWISRLSLADLFRAVALDSGPPLYYLLTKIALFAGGDVFVARLVSLVAAAAAVAAIALSRLPFVPKLTALLLLAAAPLHVHFSTEARAYALCGAAVGFAAVALDHWRHSGSIRPLSCAVAALLVAAYSHYYGVLAFPLLIAAALLPASWKLPRSVAIHHAVMATLATALLYAPGFALAYRQPRAATAWMDAPALPLLSFVRQLAFAAPYPAAVMQSPPVWLQWVAMAAFLAVAAAAARHRSTWWWGAATLVPAIAATVVVLAGGDAYFPSRFESIIIVPLVLWLGVAIATQRAALRRIALVVLLGSALATVAYAVAGFAAGVADPYRDTARVAARVVPRAPIVVSGLSYLEVVSARGSSSGVIAFPAEQALHPGWRATAQAATLDKEASLIASRHETIFWVGEARTVEQRAIGSRYRFTSLYRNGALVFAYGIRR